MNIFRQFRLKKAIGQIMNEHEELFKQLAEAEKQPITNLTWQDDDGLYRAWSYNQKQNRYYFNDIGDEMFLKVWTYIFKDGGENELSQGKLVEL
jgi:hypothetical protein